MNVIVSNRQKEIIDNANIDAIKDLNGLFNVDDLINKFKNYFFSKMILDATSIVDFASRPVLTTLAEEIGAEKLIILLPESPEPPMDFKKLLIELKIYNFTTNIDDVIKFIDTPNTYEDAMKLVDEISSSESSNNSSNEEKESEDVSSEASSDNEETKPKEVEEHNETTHSSLGDMLSNFSVHETNEKVEDSKENNNSSLVDSIENSTKNDDEKKQDLNSPKDNSFYNDLSNNSSDKNTFLITDGFDDNHSGGSNEKKVIGIKNVTLHAGSTSLIYMLHRVVVNVLKKNVLSIEIGKNDFKLFRENNMVSVDENEAKSIIDNAKEDIIFVDLNNYNGDGLCTDILYLVEPSTIMLNKLMMDNKNIFRELKDNKVILNKCLLSKNDIRTLSSEAGMEFFYNIEPLNDRILNDSIAELISLLGIK